MCEQRCAAVGIAVNGLFSRGEVLGNRELLRRAVGSSTQSDLVMGTSAQASTLSLAEDSRDLSIFNPQILGPGVPHRTRSHAYWIHCSRVRRKREKRQQVGVPLYEIAMRAVQLHHKKIGAENAARGLTCISRFRLTFVGSRLNDCGSHQKPAFQRLIILMIGFWNHKLFNPLCASCEQESREGGRVETHYEAFFRCLRWLWLYFPFPYSPQQPHSNRRHACAVGSTKVPAGRLQTHMDRFRSERSGHPESRGQGRGHVCGKGDR